MYVVFLDDKKVFEGSKEDASQFMGVRKGMLDYMDSGYVGKYWVQRDNSKVKRGIVKKRNDKTIDYLERHLKIYGNTVLSISDKPRMKSLQDEMKKRNLDFTYRVVEDQFIDKTMKKIPKKFIVLELKK